MKGINMLIYAIGLILLIGCSDLYAEDTIAPPADAKQQVETKDQVEGDGGVPVEYKKGFSWADAKYQEPKAYVINTMDELKQFYLDFSVSPNPASAAIEAEEIMKEIDPSHQIFVAVASQQITETCKSPGKMVFRRYPGGVLKARVELRIFEDCMPKPTALRYGTLHLLIFEKPVTRIDGTFPTVMFKLPGVPYEENKPGVPK